jgi:hypothetical protein
VSDHDLTEFYQQVRGKGPTCTIRPLVDRLDADQTAKLQAALACPPLDLPTTAIASVLSQWLGLKVSPQTLRRHRNGDCACG